MARWLVSSVDSVVSVGALFAVTMVVFLGWSWWELRQLRAFCSESVAGTSVSALGELAQKHGISRGWVDRGLQAKSNGPPAIYVPTAPSIGTVVCAIRHDGTVVTSASVQTD